MASLGARMGADVFFLAAGFGTRLRPLTETRPKSLVPVCGIPMLSYALAHAARHGLTKGIVNAHYLADAFERWEGKHEGVNLTVLVEPEILGTGGGMASVRDRLGPRVVVLNTDVLHDVDLSALRDMVPDLGAAMALRLSPEAARYGVVAGDATGTIVDINGITTGPSEGAVDRSTHFTGIHALDSRLLAEAPPGFSGILQTAYSAAVPHRRVMAHRHNGFWIDVGDVAAYHSANLAVLTTTIPLSLDPFSRAGFAAGPRGRKGKLPLGVTVRGAAWIGKRAEIGRNVVLQESIVGEGAYVAPGAQLTRCVVWDGREVPAGRWVDAIFHDQGYTYAVTT